MKDFGGKVLVILWKDILLELRTREIVTSVLLFALLVMVIFNFAFEPGSETVGRVAPGVIWAAFAFAGVLALNRSFALEKERGSLEGLMLCPVEREVLYFGKMLSNFLFILVVEAVALPVFAAFLDLPLFQPRLVLVVFLATLGFAAVGTLFSAIAANTRTREIMLPILFFPVVVPLLIGAVKTTGLILNNAAWKELSSWLEMMVAFDAIFMVVSALTFPYAIEE